MSNGNLPPSGDPRNLPPAGVPSPPPGWRSGGSAANTYPPLPPADPTGGGGEPVYEPCLSRGDRVISNQSAGAIIATHTGTNQTNTAAATDFTAVQVLRWCLDEVDAQVWTRNPDWDRAMYQAMAANRPAPANAQIPMLIPVQGKINPKTVTLDLGCAVIAPQNIQDENFSDAFWRIEWSSGITQNGGPDSPQTVDVDPNLGTTLQLTATRINVYFCYPAIKDAGNLGLQPALDVRASVGIGSRSSRGNGSQPRRTVKLPTMDGVATTTKLVVPQWADGVIIGNDDPNTPTLRVGLFGNTNINSPTLNSADVGKHDSESLVIRPGVRAFNVRNGGPAVLTNAVAIFYLAL